MSGRPRCSHQCCQPYIQNQIKMMYEEEGKSSRKIALIVGVSDMHIRKRLKEMHVPMRSRGAYPASRGGHRNKTHPLSLMSDEQLFLTPVDVLMERYVCSRGVVYDHRRKRKWRK